MLITDNVTKIHIHAKIVHFPEFHFVFKEKELSNLF